METCTFGADEQKLTGAKRKSFMTKCMSNEDSPRGKPIGGADEAAVGGARQRRRSVSTR